jgi:nucleotide-binding universal stress UspA family protein
VFTKVLVPLDGSDLAEGILPYVSVLAKGLGFPLVLLSVIDPNTIELPERFRIDGPQDQADYLVETAGRFRDTRSSAERKVQGHHLHERGGPYASQLYDRVGSDAKRRLEEVTKRLSADDVRVESLVGFGHAAEEIVEVAEREGCDLIAMSTRGRGALARGILGSVTDKVIHSSHVPILAITPEKAEEYWRDGVTMSKIIVPLDGSPLAESVLPYVEHLARKMSLEVILARAVHVGATYYADGFPGAGAVDLEKEIRGAATEYLKEVARRLRGKGLTVQWKLLSGHPGTTIVDLAQETPQDVIAVATHGRSGVTRWVLGSVAEALVRSAGDPVLVIPPERRD